MEVSASKGNNSELWSKLLDHLDEKLQLGLLTRIRKISSYHFEDSILYIEPGSADDFAYLSKPNNFQPLQLFACDVTKVEKVKLKQTEA